MPYPKGDPEVPSSGRVRGHSEFGGGPGDSLGIDPVIRLDREGMTEWEKLREIYGHDPAAGGLVVNGRQSGGLPDPPETTLGRYARFMARIRGIVGRS